jgi:VanZ family protein
MIVSLFYLGAKPFAVGLLPPPWDKVAHVMVFSAITWLLWGAANGRTALLVFLVVVAIGGLDELHQAMLPGRTSDAWDFLADVLASAVTAGLLLLYARSARWRR